MATKTYPPAGTNATPFNPQLQHFDWICGQLVNENRILKAVAIGVGCFSIFLSIAIIIFEANRPASIPVLVTMNDFGETRYVGPVTRKNWQNFQVPELAVCYKVKEFIELYHSLSTDMAVEKKNVRRAYKMLTSTTASKYATFLKEERPYDDFGKVTREVEFETEPLKLSGDSYQLDYKVTTRKLNGIMEKTQRYRAVATTQMMTPPEEDVKHNPLGIYITNFDIKEIN